MNVDKEKSVVSESICYPGDDAEDYRNRFNRLAKHTKSDPSVLSDWGIKSKSEFIRFLLDNFRISSADNGEYHLIVPLGKKTS